MRVLNMRSNIGAGIFDSAAPKTVVPPGGAITVRHVGRTIQVWLGAELDEGNARKLLASCTDDSLVLTFHGAEAE